MNKLAQAFSFRHACKQFNEDRKITSTDLNAILEAGRCSPSSFGLEPWHFVVIDNPDLKTQIRAVCYDQKQITTCSQLVIILYRKASQFTLQSDYLRRAVARELPNRDDETAIDIVSQSLINFLEQGLADGLTIDHWSEMQGYIAAANMMTAAAYNGIDSCAIGGFQHNSLVKILEKSIPQFSGDAWGVTLCLTFGYRVKQPADHIRWPLDDLCTFL
ncbi:NAD(P)H-dependent oxidoreductase [Orbaceae bacterium ESL0721]|nr:NAD(P)H-dependent oxidoreductase [Orbaceae bacterium ESL0721]